MSDVIPLDKALEIVENHAKDWGEKGKLLEYLQRAASPMEAVEIGGIKRPGYIMFAGDTGSYAGCAAVYVDGPHGFNEWAAENPGHLVVSVTALAGNGLLVLYTKTVTREEIEDAEIVGKILEERKAERQRQEAETNTKLAETEQKAEAAAKKNLEELRALAEDGKKWRAHHRKKGAPKVYTAQEIFEKLQVLNREDLAGLFNE